MTRDLLVGMIIGSAFGVLWVFLGSVGLADPVAIGLRVVAVALFAVILVRVVTLLRAGAPGAAGGGRSMFRSRPYVAIVVAEVLALIVGSRLLEALGLGRFGITWTAIVVGLHFLGFAWFFAPVFYRLGVVQVAIGLAGIVVGLSGGSAAAIAAVTGLTSGGSYLVGMLYAVLRRGATARDTV